MRFTDLTDPRKGIAFDGRLAEDFKLTTGTWVAVGALRVGALAAALPALQDAVVAGENREFIGLLAWSTPPAATSSSARRHRSPSSPATRRCASTCAPRSPAGTPAGRVLAAHRAGAAAADAPSIDGNEITDKGYINQRLALERRKADVERLFAAAPDADVIVVSLPS